MRDIPVRDWASPGWEIPTPEWEVPTPKLETTRNNYYKLEIPAPISILTGKSPSVS